MSKRPNLFALPPGVDFAQELISGIDVQLKSDPVQLAQSEIWVNTERTRRRLLELYGSGKPRLLPKIRLLTELDVFVAEHLPQSVSALQRRMDLRPLLLKLTESRPKTFSPSAVFELANSLALLFVEMADEGVEFKDLEGLDLSTESAHWQDALAFLRIAQSVDLTPEKGAQQRLIAELLTDLWRASPPDKPIFLAGSTGSRGPTNLLMKAVLGLERGFVILPGYDQYIKPDVWAAMEKSASPEDHPQHRFKAIADSIDVNPSDLQMWTNATPAAESRNELISMALRPAPVTDVWMEEGPKLNGIDQACADVTLIEAPNPRDEALAVAVQMRAALEKGKRVALVTPDRRLSRRVGAALSIWGIVPDDSAGEDFRLTPHGRLFLESAKLLAKPIGSESLIALLNNPLITDPSSRKKHMDLTRSLDVFLREKAIPVPDPAQIKAWANSQSCSEDWAAWLIDIVECGQPKGGLIVELGETHLALLCRLAKGAFGGGLDHIWMDEAGEVLLSATDALKDLFENKAHLPIRDYAQLIDQIMSRLSVRSAIQPHPDCLIWGTLEARVQSVNVAILAGLNEGVWPQIPGADPWLSRDMRHQVGLLSPERRIGLAAHDFQSAAGAAELFLSRSLRDDSALTVPSRWLNRITTLLQGLDPECLKAMKKRGDDCLRLARGLESKIVPLPPAPRPSPAPPINKRLRKISVTQVKTLIRDSYSIYAKQILGLRRLEGLRPKPDARLRGIALHKVFETFVRNSSADPSLLNPDYLVEIAKNTLVGVPDWAASHGLWQSQVKALAQEFCKAERIRRKTKNPSYFEAYGRLNFEYDKQSAITLSGIVDRIDIDASGSAWIYDYKTGTLPTPSQMQHFDKQLFLLALMAEEGAFSDGIAVAPLSVQGAGYLGIGKNHSVVEADFSGDEIQNVRQEFAALLRAFSEEDKGFSARSMVEKSTFESEFDHLSRRGEWDDSFEPALIRVGR